MNAPEWLAAYAERLGVEPPTAAQFSVLLEIAAEAAHSSERVAAPAATWVAANSGRSLQEALAAARGIGGEAAEPRST
jgi:Domain of unknown function (DUF6457)